MNNPYEELLSYLPPHTHDEVTKAIFKGISPFIDSLTKDLDDTQRQSDPSKTTWLIEAWEHVYGVSLEPEDTLEDRRRRINTMRDAQDLTPVQFKVLLNRFAVNGGIWLIRDPETFTITAYAVRQDLVDYNGMIETAYGVLPANTIFRVNLSDRIVQRIGWIEEQKINMFVCPIPSDSLLPDEVLMPC
ncbi:putative phage tail protein [Geomicrobium sediminis]|uniref:Uncharacterized protein YmfQ (DUF2313 family) n=1 Tax=Geomicrobium sediminis TaxID=1347788 RepID=A0ABS2PEP6_9BACL|nr:putative phage tail protein [Geomicrobium sediminis]MBM7633821.1 uncharacterized protein YmfQ (DUF2313 family) [Geomicrobium sediminis]